MSTGISIDSLFIQDLVHVSNPFPFSPAKNKNRGMYVGLREKCFRAPLEQQI